MKKLFIFLALLVYGVSALTCFCDSNNKTEFCGPPRNCSNGTVLDVCGCCDVCAKTKGEYCGGVWDMLGKCANGLECRPKVQVSSSIGAGGTFHNVLEPPGVCVDPIEDKLEHSECFQALEVYAAFIKSNATANPVHSDTNHTQQGDGRCIYKPECIPNGDYAPKQCNGCTGECWCVLRDGREIPNSRGVGRHVRCVIT